MDVALRGTCLRAAFRKGDAPWLVCHEYGPDDRTPSSRFPSSGRLPGRRPTLRRGRWAGSTRDLMTNAAPQLRVTVHKARLCPGFSYVFELGRSQPFRNAKILRRASQSLQPFARYRLLKASTAMACFRPSTPATAASRSSLGRSLSGVLNFAPTGFNRHACRSRGLPPAHGCQGYQNARRAREFQLWARKRCAASKLGQ